MVISHGHLEKDGETKSLNDKVLVQVTFKWPSGGRYDSRTPILLVWELWVCMAAISSCVAYTLSVVQRTHSLLCLCS